MTESYQYNLLLQIAIQRDKTAEVEMHSSIIVQYMYAIEVCNLSITSTLDCDQSNVYSLRDIFSSISPNTYVYSSQRQKIKYKCEDRDRKNKNQI